MRIGARTSLGKEVWKTVKQLPKVIDYIEVYYTKETVGLKKLLSLKTDWLMHGPYLSHRFNISNNNKIKTFQESVVFAHQLGAEYVILHPGVYRMGKRMIVLEKMIENINQLKDFCESYGIKIVIENLFPSRSLTGIPAKIFSYIFENFGFYPKEMEIILKRTNCEFLLDFPHAYITALDLGRDYRDFIEMFMKLKPKMFHISDGFSNKTKDFHLPLGKGNYDLKFFISQIKDHDVTMEIKPPTLQNIVESKIYIQRILKG